MHIVAIIIVACIAFLALLFGLYLLFVFMVLNHAFQKQKRADVRHFNKLWDEQHAKDRR